MKNRLPSSNIHLYILLPTNLPNEYFIAYLEFENPYPLKGDKWVCYDIVNYN